MKQFLMKAVAPLVLLAAVLGYWMFQSGTNIPSPVLPDLSQASEKAAAAIRREAARSADEPRSADRRGNFAKVLLAHQFDAAAAEEFRIASLLEPHDYRWRYLQGLSTTPLSRKAAAECFREAAELNPKSWLPRLRLAELLLAETNLSEAEPLIREARRLAPTEIRPALTEIRWMILQQSFADAVAASERLRDRGIRVRELAELHAQALFRLGRTQESQVMIRETQNDDLAPAGWNDPLAGSVLAFSTDPVDIIAEAKSLAASGNLLQAASLLQSNRRAAVHPEYYPTLARIIIEAKQPAAAISVIDEGLQGSPDSPMLLQLRGNALFMLNRLPEAEQSFRSAIQRKPDFAIARFNLAHCLLKTSGRSAAISELEAVLGVAPEMSTARLMLAGLLMDEGRFGEAQEQVQALDAMLPSDEPELQELRNRLSAISIRDQN